MCEGLTAGLLPDMAGCEAGLAWVRRRGEAAAGGKCVSISGWHCSIIRQKRLKIGFCNLASGNIKQMAEEGKRCYSHPLGKDFC